MQSVLDLNRQGFIPGPHETKEAFFQRVEYCKHLKNHLEGQLPFGMKGEIEKSAIHEAIKTTEAIYDISPVWAPIFKSNFRLPPWHGACAWIFQLKETTPTAAFVQVRKKNTPLNQERIAHELCHVSRMMFDDPKFEELFAYQTSKNWLRRELSPLIQKPWESTLFAIVMLFLIVFDFFLIPTAFEVALWLKLLPAMLIGCAFYRMNKNKKMMKKALYNLSKITDQPLPFLFRLTSEEIFMCIKKTPDQILKWVKAIEKESLRGQVLASYLQE